MYFVVLRQLPEIPIVGLLTVQIVPSYGRIMGQEEDHERGQLVWKRSRKSSQLACEPLLVVPMSLNVQGSKTLGTLRC